VVPEDWVKASTQPYSDANSGGYGYLWWTGDSTSGASQRLPFPPGSFWAEGHLGQFAVVAPSLDLIVVNRVDGDMTSCEVNKGQMARLVRMVVDIAPN
jgi:CubicO group peptidase (beta-lactamase class C family)